MRNKRVALRLPDWADHVIQEIARKKNIPVTEVICSIITKYLNDLGYHEADYLFEEFKKPAADKVNDLDQLSG